MMKREATFDETGTYRYSLIRKWSDVNERKVTFILSHPSTADEYKDDSVTKKCLFFAQKWGFGQMEIVNAFGYQAHHHAVLRELSKEDAIGYENDRYISYAIADAKVVVAAWGEHCVMHNRDEEVKALLNGVPTYCFGIIKQTYPRHVSSISYGTNLKSFLHSSSSAVAHMSKDSLKNEPSLSFIEDIEQFYKQKEPTYSTIQSFKGNEPSSKNKPSMFIEDLIELNDEQ
ncbi:DUF1643 domain-containing protein [Metabacillus iocasae]|uniref:DUF1643 domain-containing protein n=1 Tax=Priestia iocasae TaxID=2291674 RepID=A0ABS2QTB9_9BACI|nr:DUF1643 domain-containing protein [Metabacillus iocasae]MBM7702438.1 hypothetical protein [Metabacillus iocasae]